MSGRRRPSLYILRQDQIAQQPIDEGEVKTYLHGDRSLAVAYPDGFLTSPPRTPQAVGFSVLLNLIRTGDLSNGRLLAGHAAHMC